jgi:hypothetical protein
MLAEAPAVLADAAPVPTDTPAELADGPAVPTVALAPRHSRA